MIDPFDTPEGEDVAKTYKEFRQEVSDDQSSKSYNEIRDDMKTKHEGVFELDRMSPVIHRWVDRGAVMSCEGADHENHRAFKR